MNLGWPDRIDQLIWGCGAVAMCRQICEQQSALTPGQVLLHPSASEFDNELAAELHPSSTWLQGFCKLSTTGLVDNPAGQSKGVGDGEGNQV
jgi:hypothetical protein